MNNTKGQTEVGVIIFIVAFQVFVILMLGFLNIDSDKQDIGIGDFSITVITSIQELGAWNLLVFSPMIIVLIYIVANIIV